MMRRTIPVLLACSLPSLRHRWRAERRRPSNATSGRTALPVRAASPESVSRSGRRRPKGACRTGGRWRTGRPRPRSTDRQAPTPRPISPPFLVTKRARTASPTATERSPATRSRCGSACAPPTSSRTTSRGTRRGRAATAERGRGTSPSPSAGTRPSSSRAVTKRAPGGRRATPRQRSRCRSSDRDPARNLRERATTALSLIGVVSPTNAYRDRGHVRDAHRHAPVPALAGLDVDHDVERDAARSGRHDRGSLHGDVRTLSTRGER